jgi:hypothetical protein
MIFRPSARPPDREIDQNSEEQDADYDLPGMQWRLRLRDGLECDRGALLHVGVRLPHFLCKVSADEGSVIQLTSSPSRTAQQTCADKAVPVREALQYLV